MYSMYIKMTRSVPFVSRIAHTATRRSHARHAVRQGAAERTDRCATSLTLSRARARARRGEDDAHVRG